MVGNMMEFINPTASSVQPDAGPALLAEIVISVIAPAATQASTLPGANMRSSPEPMKRPTRAPPQ